MPASSPAVLTAQDQAERIAALQKLQQARLVRRQAQAKQQAEQDFPLWPGMRSVVTTRILLKLHIAAALAPGQSGAQ